MTPSLALGSLALTYHFTPGDRPGSGWSYTAEDMKKRAVISVTPDGEVDITGSTLCLGSETIATEQTPVSDLQKRFGAPSLSMTGVAEDRYIWSEPPIVVRVNGPGKTIMRITLRVYPETNPDRTRRQSGPS